VCWGIACVSLKLVKCFLMFGLWMSTEIKNLGLNCSMFLKCTIIKVSGPIKLYIFLRMRNCWCSFLMLKVAIGSWLFTIPKLLLLIFLSFNTTMLRWTQKSTLRVSYHLNLKHGFDFTIYMVSFFFCVIYLMSTLILGELLDHC